MYTETAPATLPNCGNTGAVLPGSLGPERVRYFTTDTYKFSLLNQVTFNAVGNFAESVYQLNLTKFLELLDKFNPTVYNGIRAYFACYPDEPNAEERPYVPAGMEGQLTLLFVPTFDDPNAIQSGKDDDHQFWHLGSGSIGKLTPLPRPGTVSQQEDIVTRWISHYQQNRMYHLEQDGKTATGSQDFRETRSHWYSMKTIAGDGAKDKGLLFYINCARQPGDNPVIELYIQWAAFLATEQAPDKYPKYQLSIIFYLRQQKDPPPNKHNMFPVVNPIVFGSLISASADTGLPCPPLNYCPPGGFLAEL